MRWHVVDPGDPDDITTRVYRSEDKCWTLCKEWYAQGPSLFSWMLYRGPHEFVKEFNTKKAASAYVDKLDAMS